MTRSNLAEAWRLKVTAAWICLVPVAAMVLVVALGGGNAPTGELVVGAGANRADAVFDDLAAEVPGTPGVDGRLGTSEPSRVKVPVTGVVDGGSVLDTGVGDAVEGIPAGVLPAYQRAAADIAETHPGCRLTWPLLAGIGKVESAHASGGRVDAHGATRGRILGPVLDGGPGEAAISDTDAGRLDGDTRWDRAVGPMQFIPGTWALMGTDGNADGVADPHNVYDAARSAGSYLCTGGEDLSDPRSLVAAVLRYNHSMDYVATVLRWMKLYGAKAVRVQDLTGKVADPDDDGNAERIVDPTRIPDSDDERDPGDTGDRSDTEDDLIADRLRIRPTNEPTNRPTVRPSRRPTSWPTSVPTSSRPTTEPSPPWVRPSRPPSPSVRPSPPAKPTTVPTTTPSATPTDPPDPTVTPSETPTVTPTDTPTPPPDTCQTPSASDTPVQPGAAPAEGADCPPTPTP